jgi:hypothetical protein
MSTRFESGSLGSFFVSSVAEAQKTLLIFETTRLESTTTSPVQALHVSNRTECHRVLLLLEQTLGLDQSLLVHYSSQEPVVDLLHRDRHLSSPNCNYI